MTLLSKSKYLNGIQCLKLFWTAIHHKDKLPPPDKATEQKFKQGSEVGQLAKKLFPEGIDIPEDDFIGNLKKSKELIKERKVLFEVAFMINNLYSRADILVPVGDEWDIIEVKSSTSVKEINLHDVAFQKYVYSLCGLKIRKCFLLHINNQYVKDGSIDPAEFFTKADITEEVGMITDVEERVKVMLYLMKDDICPSVKINKDCANPYDCPLEDDCWGFLPPSSVFDLYRGGKKSFTLLDEGIMAIKDIPSDYKLTDKQGIQHQCELNNSVYVNKDGLKQFLSSLVEPHYYLDFETINPAVPLYDGVRPYQQITFQWSLHVDSEHYEFLAEHSVDPRLEFLKTLKKVLGSSGSIVTYNQSFEIGRLRELALVYPSYKDWVEGVISRVVDLIVPFRNFHYYNPKQKGSCSIKKVLPAVVGKSYDDLEIGDGATASLSFLENGSDPVVRKDLLKYCCLDTEGMVWIIDKLNKLV